MPNPQHRDNSRQSQPPGKRADAGRIRLQPRDSAGLVTLAEMYASPYDLLATYLGVTQDRVRGITARWRDAGLASTGRLASGPLWCWLTTAGMRQVGHGWDAAPPPLARLAHIRAVMASRIWLESDPTFEQYRALWRCERKLRDGRPAAGQPHTPDAEIVWPSLPGSPSAGQTWCVEVELTPKAAGRTQRIIASLLAGPYEHVVYLCAPAAHQVVTAAAAKFDQPQADRILIRKLPVAALMGGAS